MRSTRLFSLFACLLMVFSASAVSAQHAPPFFVDGVAFYGFDNVNSVNVVEPVQVSTSLSGSVFGGTIAVGTFVAPRASLRFEASFPNATESTFPDPYDVLYQVPPPIYLDASLPVNSVVVLPTTEYEMKQRVQTFSVLGAYHHGIEGRVRLAYLAGAAFLRVEQTTRTSYTVPAIPFLRAGYSYESESESVSFTPAVVFGVDAEIGLTPNLKLLPQLRAWGTAGAMGIRPGIGLRWNP